MTGLVLVSDSKILHGSIGILGLTLLLEFVTYDSQLNGTSGLVRLSDLKVGVRTINLKK